MGRLVGQGFYSGEDLEFKVQEGDMACVMHWSSRTEQTKLAKNGRRVQRGSLMRRMTQKKKRRGHALNMGKFGERVYGSRKVNKRTVLMTDGI